MDKLSYKEIETYIDEYIDMGGFTKPEEAKPYLMDGFEKGYYYKQTKIKQSILALVDEQLEASVYERYNVGLKRVLTELKQKIEEIETI